MAKQMKETLSSEKEIKSSQKLLFRVLLVLMPVLILLLFEASLRLFKVGEDLSLFIENPTEGFEQYYIVNPVNGKKYFQKLEYTNPANDIFLKKKDDECFRIFVLGSSTVFGFPYEYNLMFSRILHKRLEDAYPDKKIEMINTAITAINSFTLLDYSRQISKYDPDAVLIYAGHNEFYGAFGLGSNEAMNKRRSLTFLHIRLMDLRIYQLIRNLIGSTMENIASSKSDPVHGTLMKRIVANEEISLHGEVYELTMENYQKNMEDILKIFDSKNVPVFFSELIGGQEYGLFHYP